MTSPKASYPILIIAVLLARAWTTLLHPELLFEDATELFGYYLEHRHPTEILKLYNGYISLLPNIVAFSAHWFSPTVAAFILTWFPFFIACIAYTGFINNRFSYLVPNIHIRGICCVIAASLPISKNALLLNTSYSIWSLMILLTLLYLLPTAKNTSGKILQYSIATFLICSNPISAVLLVIPLAKAVQEKKFQRFAVFTGITLLYLIAGIDHSNVRLGPPTSLLDILPVSVSRSVLEGLIGTRYSLDLPFIVSFLLSTAILISLYLYNQRTRQNKAVWHSLVTLIWLLPFIAILGRRYGIEALINPELARYFYPARWILIVCLVSALSGLVIRMPLPFKAVAGFLLIFLLLNINGKNAALYQPYGKHSQDVSEFIRQIEEGKPAVLDRGPKWSVETNNKKS